MKSSEKDMVMFRKSRKGYDKSDVHRYIEDMNIRFTTAENRYISTIRMLEQDVERLSALAKKGEEAENTASELEAVRAKLAETEASLEALKASYDALKAELESEKVRPSAPAEAAEPSLSETESKLGSILVKANLDAQKILSDAEEESRRKLAEAEKMAESIRFDAAVSARMMTESTKKELAALTEEYMKSLTALSAESAGEYKRLCDELKVKFEAAETTAKEKLNF